MVTMTASQTATPRTALGREMLDTLALLAEGPAEPTVDASELLFWVRGARAAWLLDDLELASTYYRAVAPVIMAYADSEGRSHGQFAEYSALALGCAWMAMTFGPPGRSEREQAPDRRALRTMTAQVESTGEKVALPTGGAGAIPSHPLVRIQAEMARLQAAWYSSWLGDVEILEAKDEQGRTPLQRVQQRAAALSNTLRPLWADSRESATVAVYVAAQADQPPDQIRFPLVKLDIKLRDGTALNDMQQGVTGPATIADLVDEEFISLWSRAERNGVKVDVRLPTTPGARRRDIM
ncbi:MAG: hypothetical protein CL878_05205 [Dehalococcoidia bacterium]|nr:hypothetical protein [Dehalococcoidia bacterium]